jgi:hypothetical protein
MPARRRPGVAVYHRVSARERSPRLAGGKLRAAAAARGLRVVLDVEETAPAPEGVAELLAAGRSWPR